MALKNCEHCGGEFEARASAKFCSKSCSGKAHYATNKAAYLDKAKAQRERDPEGMAAYHAAKYDRLKQDPEWLAARRTYNRAHYAANRGHKLAYGKTYYETHKESLAAYHRTRYATDKDRVLAIGKAYVSAHPEKNRAKAARYRAAKLNSTPPWQPREELDAIWEGCPPDHHVDHIHPLKGKHSCGLNVPWNLHYLPDTENISKSNRMPQPGYFDWFPEAWTIHAPPTRRVWTPTDYDNI